MPERLSDRARRKNYLRLIFVQLEKVYDAVHRFLAWITGRLGKPMTAEIYYATPVEWGVTIKGRALLAKEYHDPRPEDSRLTNLVQMFKRWTTPERPFTLLRLSVGGKPVEVRADNEGYFETDIAKSHCHSDTLLIELPESEVSESIEYPLQKVGKEFRAVVVSDIDDTVLITHAAKRLQMIATTVFGNALTRQLFPGSPELFHALHEGTSGEHEGNPINYVTSSPFNLHGLLQLIFKENGVPTGPFFMTDWGIDADKWFKISHRDHKLASLEEAMKWHPGKPVILIGDSGEHDTAIYVEAALTHPHLIDTILIRDVTSLERLEHLKQEVTKLEESGTRFAFFRDSAEAALVLNERGWISDAQLKAVTKAVESPN
ncbi:MAG: phosphatase domain-containing protein [Verrucomicrobiota bacterium]